MSTTRHDMIFFSLAVCAFVIASVTAEAVAPEGGARSRYAQETKKPPAATVSVVEASQVPEVADTPMEPEKVPEQAPDLSYIPLDKPLAETLVESCEVLSVPLELALAVIEQESRFQVDEIGADGHDVGLFQLRSSNHDWLASETGTDPLAPEGNIKCGVWFLAYLYDYCGQDWPAALTCWRWGPGNGETSEYAEMVLAAAERWR